ncbi:hypothetical protein VTO73DRAFT_4578 [Trametes versicolor]
MLSAPLRSASLPSLVESEGAAPLHLTQLTDEPNDEDPATAAAEADLVIVSSSALSMLRERLQMLEGTERPSLNGTQALDALFVEVGKMGAALGRVIEKALPYTPNVQRAVGVSHPPPRDIHVGERRTPSAWRHVDPRERKPERSQTLPQLSSSTAQQQDHDVPRLELLTDQADVPREGLFGLKTPLLESVSNNDLIPSAPTTSATFISDSSYIDGGDYVTD